MKARQLGRTDAEVSSLCLGAMYFGSRNDKATRMTNHQELLEQVVEESKMNE